jgi:Fe-S cluster biogenesis protein NfuA
VSELQDLRTAGDRIERLLDELQATADPSTRARAEEALRLVSELYGAGLARTLELAREIDPLIVEALVADDLVSSLLLVHGLHPESLTQRIEAALERVRPTLGAHAGDVELLDIDEDTGSVRIRLLGSCDGCPSSSITLQTAVQRAISQAAPEITTIDVDEPAPVPSAVPIALTQKQAYAECPAEMAEV